MTTDSLRIPKGLFQRLKTTHGFNIVIVTGVANDLVPIGFQHGPFVSKDNVFAAGALIEIVAQ